MNDIAALVVMKPSRKGLQLHQRQSNGTCPVGHRRDPTAPWYWSASHQTHAQTQRHRSLGDRAENRWVETMPAEVVNMEWTDEFITNAQHELTAMVKDWKYDY